MTQNTVKIIESVPSLQSVCSDGNSDVRRVAQDIASALREAPVPSEEPVAPSEEMKLLRKIAEEIRWSAGPRNSHGVVTKWATGSLHEAYRDALEAARFLK